jgi:putative FmdB family regulatory protein
MPTYEYQCTKCNHTFEEFKSMNAPRRQRCPVCRGKVERLISGGTGVVFKGSGFYVTDSRRASDTRRKSANGTESATATKDTSAAAAAADKPSQPAKSGGDKKTGTDSAA